MSKESAKKKKELSVSNKTLKKINTSFTEHMKANRDEYLSEELIKYINIKVSFD